MKKVKLPQWLYTIFGVMARYLHVHKWEYEQDIEKTIRTCKKCGVKHINRHIVSQIYGGEHWYDY